MSAGFLTGCTWFSFQSPPAGGFETHRFARPDVRIDGRSNSYLLAIQFLFDDLNEG